MGTKSPHKVNTDQIAPMTSPEQVCFARFISPCPCALTASIELGNLEWPTSPIVYCAIFLLSPPIISPAKTCTMSKIKN